MHVKIVFTKKHTRGQAAVLIGALDHPRDPGADAPFQADIRKADHKCRCGSARLERSLVPAAFF